MHWGDFETYYQETLHRLGLFEQRTGERIVLLKRRSFLWLALKPRIMGMVLEKPWFREGKLYGEFRATAGMKGPVWELAEGIGQKFGIETEVSVNPFFPSR
jgi:hypothetical protein